MGCDIHLSLEYERWPHWRDSWCLVIEDANLDRNYDLFGYIAGVRGEGPAVVEPRGLPIGVNERIAIDCAHTPTWLTPDELERAMQSTNMAPCCDYWAVLAAAREIERRGFVARFVIYFDS